MEGLISPTVRGGRAHRMECLSKSNEDSELKSLALFASHGGVLVSTGHKWYENHGYDSALWVKQKN